jgi:hypothetical protein
MKIAGAEFQKRLDDVSEYNGVPYGRMHLLFEEEEKHSREAVQLNKGYVALSNAFKCHFLETVELHNVECHPKVTTPLSEFYVIFVPQLVHSFQSLCGAERLALKGYPYQAYTLLRNIFDNLVLFSAALQKMTDFYSIEGLSPGAKFDIKDSIKLRKATENSVLQQMTGKLSGLSQSTIDELKKWDDYFNYEVHGARVSLSTSQAYMKGQKPLPVVPKYNKSAFGMFANRYCEVGWMTHRLLPTVQPPSVLMPSEWKKSG